MTTTNMSLNEPSVGQTAGPDWATEVNANFTTIDQHDHTSGKGVQLTPSALNINSDLEFNGNAAIELKRLTFDSSATGSGTNYSVYQSGGNLYWYNGSGQAVQITNGANVKTTGGSIDGMSGTDAQVLYGSGIYRFEFDTTLSPFSGAKMAHGDILLYKYDGSSGSDAYVILKYTGSSAGSNNITVPDETGTMLTTSTSFGGNISIAATGGSNTITLDAEGDINLDSNSGVLTFKDNGTAIGKISNSSSDLVIENEVDAKDTIFKQYDGNEVVRMADDRRLYFFDKGGEYIVGDGTDLTVASGAAINLNAGTLDLSAQTVDVTLNNAVDALNFDSNTLSIDASNNSIGIGTNSPTAGGAASSPKLHVNGNTRLDGNVAISPSSATPYISAGTSGLTFRNNDNSASLLTILNGGNVGIGKTPSTNLDVLNTAQITGAEGTSASLYLVADEGDDNGDGWRINSNQDVNDLTISSNTSGAYVDKLTIASTGKINTTSTNAGTAFEIENTNGSTNYGLFIKAGTSSSNTHYALGINNSADSAIFRVMGNGNVGIGTTTTGFSGLSTNKSLSVLNTDGTDSVDRPAVLELACSNKGDGVHVGKIDFWSDVDGGDDNVGTIICAQDGTTSNNVGGKLRFLTKADGGSLTDRLIIDQGGYIKLATNGKASFITSGNEVNIAEAWPSSSSTMYFNYDNDNTISTFAIYNGGGGFPTLRSGTYDNTSDYRLKENIENIGAGILEKINLLRPINFDWISKDSDSQRQAGFLAHEVDEVFPLVVSGKKDAMSTEKDGEIETQFMRYSALTAYMVKAIQELSAKVTALEGA